MQYIDDNARQLMEEFPKLFANTKCDCHLPIGWISRTRQMLNELQDYSNSNNINIEVTQLKEKFGTIRCYLNTYADKGANQIIQRAYDDLLNTCESCGIDDAVLSRIEGRVSNLCKKCKEVELNNNKN